MLKIPHNAKPHPVIGHEEIAIWAFRVERVERVNNKKEIVKIDQFSAWKKRTHRRRGKTIIDVWANWQSEWNERSINPLPFLKIANEFKELTKIITIRNNPDKNTSRPITAPTRHQAFNCTSFEKYYEIWSTEFLGSPLNKARRRVAAERYKQCDD